MAVLLGAIVCGLRAYATAILPPFIHIRLIKSLTYRKPYNNNKARWLSINRRLSVCAFVCLLATLRLKKLMIGLS